jgi:hypothetical protein
MKYYIYISDTKVDMHYEQIPPRLRDKLATELKIDLKFLSTTFSQKPNENSKYAKLQLVEDFIQRHFDVGTIDNPQTYFRGSLPLRWGAVESQSTPIAFFSGMTSHTILGLAGSLRNVIGQVGSSKTEFPARGGNFTAYGVEHILETLRGMRSRDSKIRTYLPAISDGLFDIAKAVVSMKGPEQKLEFLAIRLLEGDEPSKDKELFGKIQKKVLLGSPIYVALAE